MSYFKDRLLEADACEEQAKLLTEKSATIRKEIQDLCEHPYKFLTFTYGATTSYLPSCVEHSMNIRCSMCGKSYTSRLVEHKVL